MKPTEELQTKVRGNGNQEEDRAALQGEQKEPACERYLPVGLDLLAGT